MPPANQPSSPTTEPKEPSTVPSGTKPKRDLVVYDVHKHPKAVVELHNKRMIEDRAYAEMWLKRSFPAGFKFTVVFEVKDVFAVQELFEAVHSHPSAEQLKEHETNGTQHHVKTVCGCSVIGIVGENMMAKMKAVDTVLKQRHQ